MGVIVSCSVLNHFYGLPPRKIKRNFEKAIKDPKYQHFLLLQVIGKYCAEGEFTNRRQLTQLMAQCGVLDEKAVFAYWFSKLPEGERVEQFLRSEHSSKVVKDNIKIDASLFLKDIDGHDEFIKQLQTVLSNEMAEILIDGVDEFYLDGVMYGEGTESLRVLVAVPIALMLSLLFSVIGSIRLVCEVLKPLFDSIKSSYILFGLLVALVFFVPFGGKYGSYQNSIILSWAMKYQPVVYFIGKGVRTKFL